MNVDINTNAAIAYSKLNLTNGIVNADISPLAAIADRSWPRLTSAGKVADAALSANIARRAGPNTFWGKIRPSARGTFLWTILS